ncbi:putative serine/threonine-protein kinase PBL22 [Bidens hawaiensis]|uniref:putative serine/threonine-protein kinase PBL22 n=1 Tax=Bidens hawaiensis TaxID=980011 RepID=UPI0040494A1A
MFMSKKLERKAESSPRHILKLYDIPKATNNFDESLIIGRGWCGDVYFGEVFNVPAAFRRISPRSREGAKDSWPEVEKQGLCALRHPNLVSLIAYCNEQTHQKETVLVSEFISNGTLKDHLHARRTPLPCLQRLQICVGVARGIRHLHNAGVMHGDIRSSNIFLTDTWVPKVGDFGLSKLGFTYCDDDDCDTSHFECNYGMFGYLDGYSIQSGGLTMSSDVYSFGVLLLELLCRKPAVDGRFVSDNRQRSLLRWVRLITAGTDLEDVIDSGLRKQISPTCLKDLFDIAERCTNERIRARPAIAEVVARLETVLTLQERFSNPVPSAPSVKEFVFNDLKKATQESLLLLDQAGSWKVCQGWVEENTSDESAGIAVAVVSITTDQLHNDWLEEVKFLEQLAHPNTIRLLGHCIADGHGHGHLLVYEHLEKSLSRFIRGGDHLEPLSWKTRLNILIGVARGLKHLCTVKGVHCNFLIDDILLDEYLNAKFGGFGYVEIQQRHGRELLKGVFDYLKPEYDPINSYLPMDDVCSFGLVLLETITAKHPGDIMEELVSLEMRAPKCFSRK